MLNEWIRFHLNLLYSYRSRVDVQWLEEEKEMQVVAEARLRSRPHQWDQGCEFASDIPTTGMDEAHNQNHPSHFHSLQHNMHKEDYS